MYFLSLGEEIIGVWEGGQKHRKNVHFLAEVYVSSALRGLRIFFWLMTIADCPLMGQSASGLNLCDDSGRRPLAD